MVKKSTYEELEQRVQELEAEGEKRRQTEKSLQESNDNFRAVVELAHDGVVVIQDNEYKYVNEAWIRTCGYSMDELRGKTIEDLVVPEDKRKILGHYQTRIEGDYAPSMYETQIMSKDGTIKDLELSASIINWEGRPADMAVLRDTTVRRQADETLRESEEKYKTLIEMCPDPIMIFQDHQVKLINSAFTKLFGYSKDEISQINDYALVQEQDREATINRVGSRVLGKDVSKYYSQNLVAKNGDIIPCEISASVINYDKRPAGMILVRDITERKQAEEALRISNRKFSSIFTASPNAIIISSLNERRILDVNDKCIQLSGYSREELVGQSLDKVNLWGDQEQQNKFKTLLKEKGEILNFEMTFAKKSGELGTGIVSGVLFTLGGEPCVLAILNDITAFRHLEAQLRQAQKIESLGTLAGGIAHEFNNIIGIIIGNTELAISDVSDEHGAYRNLEEIQTASLRAREVVRQLLAFSRKTRETFRPLSLSPLVKDTLKLIQSSIPSTIKIRQNISAKSDTVNADLTQINQVIINLCTNASHAMQEKGGTIEVSLDNIELGEDDLGRYHDLSAGNYVRLKVSDTGCGIAEGTISSIFDPFFTTKDVGQGTGLGLSVVHGIIKDHGGDINVRSEQGKGTSFHILFPVVDWILEPDAQPSEPTPRGIERILFVDDEQSIVFAAKHNLEGLGYKVVGDTDPVHALKTFQEEPDEIDLVITDATMPGMTGDGLAREILKIRPDCPVILCTGYSERISEEMAQEMGIKAFVMKPVVTHEMANLIRQVLDSVKEETVPYTSKRILVVDDDEQMRTMIRQMLESSGFKVSEAPDGKVALWIAKEKHPDLVVTDIVMPEKEGLETIMELKHEFPDTKIIAISGAGADKVEAYLNLAKKMGADFTLTKPFEKEKLLKAVKEVLG